MKTQEAEPLGEQSAERPRRGGAARCSYLCERRRAQTEAALRTVAGTSSNYRTSAGSNFCSSLITQRPGTRVHLTASRRAQLMTLDRCTLLVIRRLYSGHQSPALGFSRDSHSLLHIWPCCACRRSTLQAPACSR